MISVYRSISAGIHYLTKQYMNNGTIDKGKGPTIAVFRETKTRKSPGSKGQGTRKIDGFGLLQEG